MKFRMRLKEGPNRTWTIEPDIHAISNMDEARAWAVESVREHNALRDKKTQPLRELLEVLPCEEIKDPPLEHDWYKTNLVTIIPDRGLIYDTYSCRSCHTTGKRFGLQPFVSPDDPDKPFCKRKDKR